MEELKSEVLGLLDGDTLINLETGEVVENEDKLNLAKKAGVPVISKTDNLAVGFVVNEYQPTPLGFLRDLKEYQRVPDDIYKQIDICNKIYRHESIVGTAVDILVEFAVTDVMIQNVDNDEAFNLLEWYNNNVNGTEEDESAAFSIGIQSFLQQGALEYFISGNAFPYQVWREQKVEDLNNKTYNLPVTVRYLNPQTIEIPEAPNAFGKEILFMKPFPAYSEYTTTTMLSETELSKYIPEDIQKYLNQRERTPLPSEYITHIARKKRDYETWGTPYLLRVLDAVASKKRLRRLDDATVDGMVNYITIFKVGSENPDSPYHQVSQARLNAVSALLTNPNATSVLVWPHDLTVETVGPEGKVLEFDSRYQEANSDIIGGLGVPRLLIDGTGRISAEWVVVGVLIERLEQIRFIFKKYLERLYKIILEENGFNDIQPKVTWTRMSLKNEKEVKNMILAFYDRGLLPIETSLTEAGYDFQEQWERQKDEIDKEIKDVFKKPMLPFDSPQNQPEDKPIDKGRPPDKTDTPVDRFKPEIKSTGESVYERRYLETLQTLYAKILNKLKKRARNDTLTSKNVQEILNTGFAEIHQVSLEALIIGFEEETDETTGEELMLQRLLGWNDHYIEKFKHVLSNKIEKAAFTGQVLEKDLLIALLIGIFQTEEYRLPMFAEEGLTKAIFAGEAHKKATDGAIGGFLTAAGVNPCEACAGHDGNWYTINELFDLWPLHPNCECVVGYTTNNPILDGEHQNTPVRQDPKNPSELI